MSLVFHLDSDQVLIQSMWNFIKLILVYTCLVSFVSCATKMSPYGEPMGALGPTIVEKPHNVDDDVKTVVDAITQTKSDPIVKIICERTLAQRIAIDKAYQLKSDKHENISFTMGYKVLGGRYQGSSRSLVYQVFYPLPVYLARQIHFSFLRGQGDADWLYMSIICTGSVTKLKAVMEVFENATGYVLDKHIHEYMGRKGAKLAINRMLKPETMRPDSGSDATKVDEQVKLIPNKDQGCDGYDLMVLLTSSSFEQIKLVVTKWKDNQSDKNVSVAEPFRKHCKKELRTEMYKRIVRYADDPYQYLAEELYLSMAGESHNSNANDYIVITRSEVDLKDVLAAFNKQYGNYTAMFNGWTESMYVDILKAFQNGNTGENSVKSG